MFFFLLLNVWLVFGLYVAFLLPDCGSALGFACVCLYVCVFLLLRA